MNATPGAIIASSSPGDIAGSVAPPANAGNIMQNMFTQMISPEQIPAVPTAPSANPAPVVPGNPVTLTEPKRESVQFKEPDVSLFTDEPKEEEVKAAPVDDEPDMSDIPDEPAKENWKKAREALKNERKTLKQINKDFEATRAKLEKYEKGEVVH